MSSFDLNYIKRRREELKLTMDDMAKKLGLSNHSVYWKYENGDYKFKAEMLPRLASALQCDISHFYA